MIIGFSRSRKLLSLVLSAEVALGGLTVGLPAAAEADGAVPGTPYRADGTYDVTVPAGTPTRCSKCTTAAATWSKSRRRGCPTISTPAMTRS
mgnify:CR=1 FL=1